MFHQLLATVCGLTLHTQVNACSITLQQATVKYNAKIDQKLTLYKKELEETDEVQAFKNEYTIGLLLAGKTLYEKSIVLNYKSQNVIIKPNQVRWEYSFAF